MKALLDAPRRRLPPMSLKEEDSQSQPIVSAGPLPLGPAPDEGGRRLVGAVHITMGAVLREVPVELTAHHAVTALLTSPATVRLFLAIHLHTSALLPLTISI